MKTFTGRALTALGFLSLGACSAEADFEQLSDVDEPVGESAEAFQNSISFVGCGAPQTARLQRAGNILSDRIYESQGTRMRACLMDAFISNSKSGHWAGDIWASYNRAGTTTMRCSSNIGNDCGGLDDWWGCASEGSEDMRLANQMINDPLVSDAEVAGLIAHELAHNYGHKHSGLATNVEYEAAVTQRVRACVANNNTLPASQSRTASMPGEVELGPVGRFGGSPYEHGCTTDYVNGFSISAASRVDGMRIRCESGGLTVLRGNAPSALQARNCAAGSVVVGVRGRAGTKLDQLNVVCAPKNNLGARTELGALGGGGGQPFESFCPPGKAVRRIRGRSGTEIDRFQLVCDTINRSFSSAHYPAPQGITHGTATGPNYHVRCSGDGALSALTGRAAARVDRLSGVCSPTGASFPLTIQGPNHMMVPAIGGGGGSEFTNACPADELMVGLRVRSGSRVDAVSPICANAMNWDSTGSGQHNVATFNGGSGGTLRTAMCPQFQFLVGFNLWSVSEIDGLQLVCRDMR